MNVQDAIAKLTESGKHFMTLVGTGSYDFFDGGIVEGEGNWGENLADGLGKSAKSASGIMNGTKRLGLWATYLDSGQMWWSLTELGAAVANELAAQVEAENVRTADGPVIEREETVVLNIKTGAKWTYLYDQNGELIAELRNGQFAAIKAFIAYQA